MSVVPDTTFAFRLRRFATPREHANTHIPCILHHCPFIVLKPAIFHKAYHCCPSIHNPNAPDRICRRWLFRSAWVRGLTPADLPAARSHRRPCNVCMSFHPHEVSEFVRSNPTIAEALAQLPPEQADHLTKVLLTTAALGPILVLLTPRRAQTCMAALMAALWRLLATTAWRAPLTARKTRVCAGGLIGRYLTADC